jgi:hypothetical protein
MPNRRVAAVGRRVEEGAVRPLGIQDAREAETLGPGARAFYGRALSIRYASTSQ